jgi:hypothetical protein
MALHDALAEASCGCLAVCLTTCGDFTFRSIGDNRSTNSVEPLSPMALHDALAEASCGCLAVCLTTCGDFTFRSIGDNRSTNSVEPLSPMALHDALAAASYGCSVLARRAALVCRCASANRGCCLKPPTKVGRANQRGLSLDFPE